ncbi:TIGR04255 family protein [Methylorubrum extorquens]|nr:TIGR04255 family protein [Methylorubrum extorquens]
MAISKPMEQVASPEGQDVSSTSPLLEMRMSVQFASIGGLRTLHLGLLWSQIRTRYPSYIEDGTLVPIFELFGGRPSSGQPQFNIQMGVSVPRIVFFTADQSFSLHVQQDRIMLVWQRFPSESAYPGYSAMRAMFYEEIQTVSGFLAAEGLGHISPNQCELTYVNAITLPGESAVHEHLERVTPVWQQVDVGLPFETASLQNRYLILSGEAPIGRLYTTFSPAFLTATEEPNYQLEIVARAKPESESLQAAFDLLDRSHDIIHCAFDRVTTSLVKPKGEG